MKRKVGLIMLALSVVGLTACATKPVVSNAQLKEKFMMSNVRVMPVDKPVQLTERTKSQAVGNFMLSSVVGSVAGSSGSAGNMQQMQSNMQISQAFSANLNRALPQNYAVDSGRGVDLALTKRLADYFGVAEATSPKNQDLYISVSASSWELGYVSFLSSQDYKLNYGLDLHIQEKLENQFRPVTTVSCMGVAKEQLPLEAWQADNYKKVNDVAEGIVNSCFTQFMTSMGFPVKDQSIDGSSHAQLQKAEAP